MTQPYVIRVMEEMGWGTDRSFIPIANEANKKLLEYVNQLGDRKTNCTGRVQDSDRRLANLQVHLKNAKVEFEQNQNLMGADKSQIDTEHNMLKLAENDSGRLRKLAKEAQCETEELEKHDQRSQKEIKRLAASMERLTERIKWAKAALLEWQQVMGSGDETNKLIARYSRQDAGRAEGLEVKRKILEVKVSKRRTTLVDLAEEYRSLEQVLERTSQLYRQAHSERRQLVLTWKEAVKHMNQREEDIKTVEAEIERARELSALLNEDLQAQVDFLEEQQRNNREIEIGIAELNVDASKLRNRLNTLTDHVQLRTNEYQVTRKAVQNISNKLTSMRNKNRRALAEEVEKEKQINVNLSLLEQLRDKYENFKSKTLCAQERLRQLNEIVEQEEKQMKVLSDETARLSSALYRAQTQLLALKDEDKLLKIEIVSLESGIVKIKAAMKVQEREIIRQMEISYNVDYNMEKIAMRIANMRGENKQEGANRAHAKLMQAESILSARKQNYSLLQTQISKVQIDFRYLNTIYQQDSEDIERMTGKLKEKILIVEGGEKKLRQFTTENQERLVEKSLLKMRINQMESRVNKQNDKMYTLERHRMELETAINERLIDIRSQKDMLLLKKKYLQDERAQLKADISERALKIEQLKNRYDLSLDLLGKNDDGTIVTATQIKIQNAQEKYMLLREGSELNVKILKAEDDLKALENTLKLMNFSNENYKRGFSKVEEDEPEMQQMQQIQNDYCKALTALKSVRTDLVLNTDNLHNLNEEREHSDRGLEAAQKHRLDNNDILLKIQKELLDQKTKIQRAERELRLAIKAAKSKTNDEDLLVTFQKDLSLKELEERNSLVLHQIADLIELFPEMNPTVNKYFYDKGLRLPTVRRTKSQISWRSENSPGSEYSGRADSTSSKPMSKMSICSTSTRSSDSSDNIAKSFDNRMSAGLSVILIDFPGASSKKTQGTMKK
ncbi:coiled-coil domain-containing protein 39 [Topomyia yanbarensis]|uniref:coiled-coil domain-containing protein 39 n=1 Tax=Topomyia yanbarensis TaxID=2498891 RepID=UPI00273A9330|nr:coiled-coil domain-containing protein 39 [Topomyia yanbarensis]